MADHSSIEWTDATWNPITGCSIVSPGCTNCYAMRLAGTRLKHIDSRKGLTRDTKAGPVWTGEVRLNEQWLDQPLKWKQPRRIFVCAHGDLFAENVPDEWIDKVFAVMAMAPQHTFQVLTKRAKRMREYVNGMRSSVPFLGRMPLERIHLEASGHMEGDGGFMDTLKHRGNVYSLYCSVPWPLPNVWLGVSAERQQEADERVPELLATPAAIRFLSAEPLLGRLNLESSLGGTRWIGGQRGCDGRHQHLGRAGEIIHDILHEGDPRRLHHHHDDRCQGGLDWVIAGGENGPRPMHPDWARDLSRQCFINNVAFFFKQWGSFKPVYDRDIDDPDWRRCGVIARETPNGQWLNLAGGQGFHGERVVRMDHVGKKAAGRLLDGVEHSGFPKVAA